MDRSGSTAVSRAQRPRHDVPAAGLGVVEHRACAPQRVDRHRQVRRARQRPAGVADGDALVEPRRRQQQPAHQLGGLRRVDGDAAAAQRAVAGDAHRQPVHAVQVGAQLAQRGQQRAERPLPHPGIAVEADRPLRQRRDRRQEPRDCAGVADVDRLATRLERAARPLDDPAAVRPVGHRDPQHPERGRHQLGVAAAQRTAYDGPAARQRGQHERAVGLALRARQRHDGVERAARPRSGPEGSGGAGTRRCTTGGSGSGSGGARRGGPRCGRRGGGHGHQRPTARS